MRHATITILLIVALAVPARAELSQDPEATQQRIADLVEQLGAPKYVARRTAQERLREEGLAAFDQLLEAAKHPDPEVAASATRLLQTMTIRWTRRGDSPEVRRLLEPYSGQDEQQRRETLRDLATRGEEGVPALCRIARFDVSGRVSREAALAVLAVRDYKITDELSGVIAAAEQELDSEYGPSLRVAAGWLRLFVEQLADPASSLDGWRRAIAAEQRVVDERRPESDERLLAALRWNWLRAQLTAGESGRLRETVDAITDALPQLSQQSLTTALEWMVEADADEGIDELLDSRKDELVTKRGLYLAAMIRDKQGRLPLAADLAEQAFETPPSPDDEQVTRNQKRIDGRVYVGFWLRNRGYAEWASREYRAAALATPALTVSAAYARWLLADSQFDNELYAEAGQTLGETLQAVGVDITTRARYESMVDEAPDKLVPERALAARRDYYLSMAARDAGQGERQVELLRAALGRDSEDADYLIAFYRAAKASGDERLLGEAVGMVRSLAEKLQEQIDSSPDDSVAYNHWAWLIGNTEGDFAKAVRYSRRSLTIRPGDAGYLDTLGRCYYALGDLEQAVKHQRDAVRREPHMMVLKRQLDLFESELAKQQP